MVWLELVGGKRRVNRGDEGIKPVFVLAVCVCRPVFVAPVEEFIHDDDNQVLMGRRSRWRCDGRTVTLLHETVMGFECGGFVAAKIDLFPVDLDVPEATVGTEKRFGKMRHWRISWLSCKPKRFARATPVTADVALYFSDAFL